MASGYFLGSTNTELFCHHKECSWTVWSWNTRGGSHQDQQETTFNPLPSTSTTEELFSLILHNELTFFFVGQDPYPNTGSPLFRLGSENLPDHRVHDLGAMNHAPIGKLESLVPQSARWNFPAHLLVLTCFARTLYICFLQTSRTEYKLEALLLHLPMWFSLELNSVSRNV